MVKDLDLGWVVDSVLDSMLDGDMYLLNGIPFVRSHVRPDVLVGFSRLFCLGPDVDFRLSDIGWDVMLDAGLQLDRDHLLTRA